MNNLTQLLQSCDSKTSKLFFSTFNQNKDYTNNQIIDYFSFICKFSSLDFVKFLISIIKTQININDIVNIGLNSSLHSCDTDKVNYFIDQAIIIKQNKDPVYVNLCSTIYLPKLEKYSTVERLMDNCIFENKVLKKLLCECICLKNLRIIKLIVKKTTNIVDNEIIQLSISESNYLCVKFLLEYVNIEDYKLNLSFSEMNIIKLVSNYVTATIDLDLASVLSSGKLNFSEIKLLVNNNVLFTNSNVAFVNSLYKSSILGVKISLYLGCNIHFMDDIGLKISSSKGNLEIVKLLINNGINPVNEFALAISKKNGYFDVYNYLKNDYYSKNNDYKFYITKKPKSTTHSKKYSIVNRTLDCLGWFRKST